MKSRYELFEHKPTGKPFAVYAGWSWFAFFAPPVWAAWNGLWVAAVGMVALAGAIAYTNSIAHEARVGLMAAWLIFSAWMAEGGHRWTLKRKLSAFRAGEMTYIGEVLAESQAEAEELARQPVESRERFQGAAAHAPPDHVAEALRHLDDDGAY